MNQTRREESPELPRVERTVELGVPATELWQHLVDGELASFWMGGVMTIEPRLNGRVLLHADDAAIVFGTVEELVVGESITWTWRTRDGEPTQVSIIVEPAAEGSVLRVTEQLIPYEIIHVPTSLG
ncbi:MAG TPA: SRPBCC domain-containing protein [Acidimicrobiia bacterium]|nr:SRPBCC domain-containing protein [Acidimicrobiia bacterium]